VSEGGMAGGRHGGAELCLPPAPPPACLCAAPSRISTLSLHR
jgi:hypothetical protein